MTGLLINITTSVSEEQLQLVGTCFCKLSLVDAAVGATREESHALATVLREDDVIDHKPIRRGQ